MIFLKATRLNRGPPSIERLEWTLLQTSNPPPPPHPPPAESLTHSWERRQAQREERRERRGRRSGHWRGAAIKPSRCGGGGRNNGLKGSADSERRPEFGRKMQGRGGKRWCPSFRHVSDELNMETISTRFRPESTKNSPSNAACIRWRLAHARCSLAGNTEPTNEAAACSARVTLHSVGKHVSLGNRTINRLTLKAEGR